VNQPGSTIYERKHPDRAGARRILFTIIVLLLSACGFGGGGAQGEAIEGQNQLPPQSEALLTCSQECADRGWCGTTNDQRAAVLGKSIDPAAASHDLIFLQDTRVYINYVGLATVELVATGEQSQLPFYYVTSLDQGKSAWIAGWCIAAP